MMRYLGILVIPLALALASCADDDNDPTDTSTEADAPDEVVDGVDEPQPDAEPDGVDDPVDDPTPEVEDDPEEDAEEDSYTPSTTAEYFCDSGYEPACGYGGEGRFPGALACYRAYDSWTTAQQICAGNALGTPLDCDLATDPTTSC
jgi:hypothetical protein